MSDDVVAVLARFVAAVRADDYGKLRDDTQKIYQDQAVRCIAALRAAGFRVVPYEPTEAMLDVVVTPIAKSDYQTMLDAAENGDG